MIKISDGKLTFEVENEAELRAVMNVISKNGHAPIVAESRLAPTQDSFVKLYKGFSSNAIKVIGALKDKPKGMTLDDSQTLGLSGSILVARSVELQSKLKS